MGTTYDAQGRRHRDRGGYSPASYQSAFWTTPASAAWTTVTGLNRLGTYETMWDHVNPNFLSGHTKGDIYNTPMSRTKEERTGSDTGFRMINTTAVPGQTQYYETTSNCGLVGLGIVGHLATGFSPDDMVDEARTACLAGISAPTQEGLVSGAELLKTLRMIARPAGAIRDLVATWGRRNKARSLKDAIAGSWLEYRYGWRPLMFDIESALDALAQVYGPRQTSRATRSFSTTVNQSGQLGITNGVIALDGTITTAVESTVRAYSLYDWLTDWGINSTRAHGLRASDIPSAMWELVPYSFVVDWLVNTADVIKALSPRGDVRRLAEGYVVKTVTTTTRNISGSRYVGSTPGWSFSQILTGTHQTRTENVYRVVGQHQAVLKLKQNYTAWSKDLRLVDAIFLLSNAAKSR